jgi:hypothetical protein
MTEIEMALPCNFSGSAVVPAGSAHYVIYLAPLNAHTRAVFESVLARNTDVTSVPGLSFTVSAGKQSFAEGDAESSQLESRSKSRCLGYGVNADGSVTISPGGGPHCPASPATTTTSFAPAVALANLAADCQAFMRTRTYQGWRSTGVVPLIGSNDPGIYAVLSDLYADARAAQPGAAAPSASLQSALASFVYDPEQVLQGQRPVDVARIVSALAAIPAVHRVDPSCP